MRVQNTGTTLRGGIFASLKGAFSSENGADGQAMPERLQWGHFREHEDVRAGAHSNMFQLNFYCVQYLEQPDFLSQNLNALPGTLA